MLILRPRLQGSGQIFERTKTCTDPPFVYMGPEQLLKYSNIFPDLYKPVEGRKRMFSNTMMPYIIIHHFKYIIWYKHSACSVRNTTVLPFFSVFLWTGEYDSNGYMWTHIYIYFFILFFFVLKTEGKRLKFKKYPDTCWRGLSEVKLYTYLLHFALSSAILKMWVSQVVMAVCNAWIAAVSIETCACVVRTDGRTVTWQQVTMKISRMHR